MNTSVAPAAGADLLYGGTTLTLTNSATLSLNDLGSNVALTPGTKFTLISYNSTWNNGVFTGHPDDSTFSFANNSWRINYNDTTAGSNFFVDTTGGTAFVTIEVVPEPATWALLAFSLTTVMVLRRRRNS